jgi:hypothetical protein
MRDRFVRVCLGLIILLLAVIACQQGPTSTDAAALRAYTYKCVFFQPSEGAGIVANQIQNMLNQQARDGWELVKAPDLDGYYIFKK